MKIIKICLKIILFLFIFLLFLLFVSDIFNDINLGGDYFYNSYGQTIVGKNYIPTKVIAYDYDEHVIIVKQKPFSLNSPIYDEPGYDYEHGLNYIYYWIILKDEQKVFGPLDSNKFHELKIKYKIPKSLKFE